MEYVFEKVHRDTKKDYIDFRYYAEKLFSDRDFTEAFEFITEGVGNMFITNKNTDEAMILYKVIRTIKQLLGMLHEDKNPPKFSSMNASDILASIPSFVRKNNSIKNFANVMEEELPKGRINSRPKFSQPRFRMKNMANKNEHQEKKEKEEQKSRGQHF